MQSCFRCRRITEVDHHGWCAECAEAKEAEREQAVAAVRGNQSPCCVQPLWWRKRGPPLCSRCRSPVIQVRDFHP